MWSVVECSHSLILLSNHVAFKDLVHDHCAFLLCHVTDDIASEQSKSFSSHKLIEEGQDQVRIGTKWVSLEVFKESKDEGLLLILADEHEVRVVFFFRHWEYEHWGCLSILHKLYILVWVQNCRCRVIPHLVIICPDCFNCAWVFFLHGTHLYYFSEFPWTWICE